MRLRFHLAVLLLAACGTAVAQVQPAATGAGVPAAAANFNYSVRYSETAEFGGGIGDWQTSALSADLDYSNGKQSHPLSLQYGGGYNWTLSGPAYGSGLFQHLFVSQAISRQRWNASLSDDAMYTPEAPTFGFTGIPGIGEPLTGSNPGQTPGYIPNQSILTLNTHVVENTSSAEVGYKLTRTIGTNFGASYDIFRFPNDDGLSSNTASGNAGVNWRLDRRNSVTASYRLSKFTYPDLRFSLGTHTGTLGLTRIWSRSLTSTVSAGPQWTSSSESSVIPSALGIAVTAALDYHYADHSAGLSYMRGVNNGGGYLSGAQVNTLSADYSRTLRQTLTLAFTASYMRTSAFPNSHPVAGLSNWLTSGTTTAKFGAVQANKRLGRYLNVFANYSLMEQSSSSRLPANALGQLMQVIGFGIAYSPSQERTTH